MAKEKQKTKKKDKDEDKKKGKKTSSKKRDVKIKKPKKDKGKAAKTSKRKKVSAEERIDMIRTAAYYLAEKRGHHGNYELDDWIAAEKEISKITK